MSIEPKQLIQLSNGFAVLAGNEELLEEVREGARIPILVQSEDTPTVLGKRVVNASVSGSKEGATTRRRDIALYCFYNIGADLKYQR